MADDGMLLNFATGDVAAAPKLKFKGGHWKDRLHLKRQARKPRFSGGQDAVKDSQHDDPPPTKRLKVSQFQGHSSTRPGVNPADSRPRYDGPPREVISSLFTYNPGSTLITEEKVEDPGLSDILATNAPLIDGLDTFTSLGLSHTVAAHLLTKMNIKAPTAIQKSTMTQLIQEDCDAFIQAETGSGKTLAYLLPIVHRLVEVSKAQQPQSVGKDGSTNSVHRDSGLFAIILAPTRELSKQISVVLESLLRCAHWIVAGTVLGGEKKKSEKARLRKGINILVATPGRLVDHLSNTEALDVSSVRWLVLDEGDRLMELGFEEDIKEVLSKLKGQSRRPRRALPGMPDKRVTILCSATMKSNVERLGEMSLEDAIHIKGDPDEKKDTSTTTQTFMAPAQLKQSYAIVPPKQRLVTLAAYLKRTFARKGSVMKAIVFVSCADSVDFHFSVLSKKIGSEVNSNDYQQPHSMRKDGPTSAPASAVISEANPDLHVYRLHGSLPQSMRTSTLASFSKSEHPSILMCTDVASRGLDLPSVDLVLEYDPAFSADDHLHRIGRTARAGRDGRASIFLMPGPEEGYIEVLKKSYKEESGANVTGTTADEILQRGFQPPTQPQQSAGKRPGAKPTAVRSESWEDLATEWQLGMERWIIEDNKTGDLARRAYISHVRAYATHTAAERGMFNVKDLHLGHLAKAFALRDKPGSMGRTNKTAGKKGAGGKDTRRRTTATSGSGKGDQDEDNEDRAAVEMSEAKRKMRMAMKVHMGAANEFNIG